MNHIAVPHDRGEPLKCIICQHTMVPKMIRGIEIDLCTHCGGVWLDRGEFERLSNLDPSEYRQLICTQCHEEMLTRTIYGVEIDLCPHCGGIWLDHGELEKIVGLNPFGHFGQNEFELFREAVLMSRELERFSQQSFSALQPSGSTLIIINDVFLVYKDGCLIVHKTRRLKPDMDDDVLSAMFVAIQRFIEDSFKDERETRLKRLSFGESEILIEPGKYTFIAAVVSGSIPEHFPKLLAATVLEIERQYGDLLRNWDHQYNALRGAQDIIQRHLLELS